MLFQALLFPILHNIEFQQHITLIVADDELGPDIVVGRRPEGLDRVHAAPIAGEADDRLIGLSQFQAQRAGDTHTERAATRLEKVAGFGRRDITGQFG